MTQEIATDVILHNQNQPDAFGYQIALVKPTGETYSLTQYATEINVWESLFAKACICKIGIFDGAGFMQQVAMQPGDTINLTLMKDEDSKKLIKKFIISEIGAGARAGNSQAKTYTVSAMTPHAFKNMHKKVYRGMSGLASDLVKRICNDYLETELHEIEFTHGQMKIASPGKSPFQMLTQIQLRAISGRHDEKHSLFFFYEDREGIKFKTLNSLIEDADTHKFVLSVDKNVDGVADLYKIQHFAQLKVGNQAERIKSGMYQNEVVEFDHLSRRFQNTQVSYGETAQQLRALGAGDVVDIANNVEGFVNEAKTAIRGLSNVVKFRTSDEAFDKTDEYRTKHGYMLTQKAMFNQIVFAVQIFGTPEIKVGDIVDVTAPAMSMQSDAPELEKTFQGRFLVGDIRHRVVNGEQYSTILNLFKDSMETDNVREASK